MGNVVIAETKDGKIHEVTGELVSAAAALGGEVTVIVPGVNDSATGGAAALEGVNRVIGVVGDCFGTYDSSSWAEAIDAASPQGNLILAASAESKDLAARIAARRGISVIQNVIGIDGGNVTYPVYSGKAHETVSISGEAALTVRANNH